MARSKLLHFPLSIIQLFVAVGALPAGLLFIIDPTGGVVTMPLTLLADSPFSNFLIPGVLLFLLLGVGNAIGTVGAFKRRRWAGWLAILLGGALIVWIIAQVYWLGFISFLQPLMLSAGTFELLLGVAFIRQNGLR